MFVWPLQIKAQAHSLPLRARHGACVMSGPLWPLTSEYSLHSRGSSLGLGLPRVPSGSRPGPVRVPPGSRRGPAVASLARTETLYIIVFLTYCDFQASNARRFELCQHLRT